jgi:MSHA biogenesis protein MshQ
VTNTLDSCTTITTANIGLGNYQSNLAAGQTTATLSANTFAAGKTTLKLSAPGAGRNGSVSVVANVGNTTTVDGNTTCLTWSPAPAPTAAAMPWLSGQWCGATANKLPTARATFGAYRSSNRFIFQRENF